MGEESERRKGTEWGERDPGQARWGRGPTGNRKLERRGGRLEALEALLDPLLWPELLGTCVQFPAFLLITPNLTPESLLPPMGPRV